MNKKMVKAGHKKNWVFQLNTNWMKINKKISGKKTLNYIDVSAIFVVIFNTHEKEK
jgi:hypothetical protein